MRRTEHIRQRSAGSWELRYPLIADPATGKRGIATTTVHGDPQSGRYPTNCQIALSTSRHLTSL